MSDLSALQQILAGLTSVDNAHRSQCVAPLAAQARELSSFDRPEAHLLPFFTPGFFLSSLLEPRTP